MKKISLSTPSIFGNEWKYIKDCLDTEWVSTSGKYVDRFESKLAKYTDTKYCIATINGTSALHAALLLSGVNKYEEVIVPTLTFIAPVNAIRYCSASPIFMDTDEDYCIDQNKVIEFIKCETHMRNGATFNKKTNKRIRAIIIVHVYGRLAKVDKLVELCRKKNIFIIEDAAEGLGSFYRDGKFKGKHAGTIGDIGCISFNGNKVITTGGGGAILTKKKKIADQARYLITQSKDDPIFFKHNAIGYNYKMTNIHAALGLGQLEQIKKILNKKAYIYKKYHQSLKQVKGVRFCKINNFYSSNYWLNLIQINKDSKIQNIKKLINIFQKENIEVRPLWQLNHSQVFLKKYQNYKITISLKLLKSTICLPSSFSLQKKDIDRIIRVLNE